MVQRISLDELKEFSPLGGYTKSFSSEEFNNEEVQRAADDNAPRDTKATHYYPLIKPAGSGVQVDIMYFRKR